MHLLEISINTQINTAETKVLFNHTQKRSNHVKYCAILVCLMLFCMLSCNCFFKQKNVSMSAPSLCKRRQIVSRALSTSMVSGGVMRIELAALTGNCELHVQICACTM